MSLTETLKTGSRLNGNLYTIMSMTESTPSTETSAGAEPEHQPYVPASTQMAELTWPAVVVGALLGIIFGASSLYLVLKVGMTVSASIPVAVLSITLFRLFSRATILENNIVQTTGSAGESIAFGVGVTMPALMLLGFDMDVVRVMTVGVLGGLLGILMMIPLRRAFIVKQHRKLAYPEGTACADVLIVGEQGGATALTVFVGFGVAFVHKFFMAALHLWKDVVGVPLYTSSGAGLKKGVFDGELTPELLGVGYIIGPRIASIMVAGGVLAYLVLVPAIAFVGEGLDHPLAPSTDVLIRDMSVSKMRNNYILYIGAGAVTTGGIISMINALPLILASIRSGLRDIRRGTDTQGNGSSVPRTEQDLPMNFVLIGCLLLIVALAASPKLGLGLSLHGIVGAALIVLFGFLFVTVSSRLTGEVGSSSNPISGMTVATLLFTCLVFLGLSQLGFIVLDKGVTLTALSIAAVVCIAASNGGTTSQDLKTGYLIGATPRLQQWAIIIGALTSALVIGVTLLLLNEAGTVYSKKKENLPDYKVPNVAELTETQRVGGEYAAQDQTVYHVLRVREGDIPSVLPGHYLVDDSGQIRYLVDPAINGRLTEFDDGTQRTNKFDAPKTRLMALIIDGILNQKLPWGLVLLGALIAITLELSGVPSLPFAVGVYLPLSTSVPIFIGGAIRWLVDKVKKHSAAEADMSPGVLLSSGYIAGGAIGGVLIAFFEFAPEFNRAINLERFLPSEYVASDKPALIAFAVLLALMVAVGMEWLLKSNGEAPGRSQETETA
jgi:putative OPT family oligopeptide transporter